jgi:hypothetical protein
MVPGRQTRVKSQFGQNSEDRRHARISSMRQRFSPAPTVASRPLKRSTSQAITLSIVATSLAGIPGYADVSPPPGPPITLKVSGEGAKFVMRGLAIAGLDARLECFYSYSSDGRPSDLRAFCRDLEHRLLFSAWTRGKRSSELHIEVWGSSDRDAKCEADRVVQSFLSTLKGRADVSIVENNRDDDCKKTQN